MEKYIELRGECQESYYNFGRAFHTIGLLQNAAHFYKKALECPVPVQESNSVRKISTRKSTFSCPTISCRIYLIYDLRLHTTCLKYTNQVVLLNFHFITSINIVQCKLIDIWPKCKIKKDVYTCNMQDEKFLKKIDEGRKGKCVPTSKLGHKSGIKGNGEEEEVVSSKVRKNQIVSVGSGASECNSSSRQWTMFFFSLVSVLNSSMKVRGARFRFLLHEEKQNTGESIGKAIEPHKHSIRSFLPTFFIPFLIHHFLTITHLGPRTDHLHHFDHFKLLNVQHLWIKVIQRAHLSSNQWQYFMNPVVTFHHSFAHLHRRSVPRSTFLLILQSSSLFDVKL